MSAHCIVHAHGQWLRADADAVSLQKQEPHVRAYVDGNGVQNGRRLCRAAVSPAYKVPSTSPVLRAVLSCGDDGFMRIVRLGDGAPFGASAPQERMRKSLATLRCSRVQCEQLPPLSWAMRWLDQH